MRPAPEDPRERLIYRESLVAKQRSSECGLVRELSRNVLRCGRVHCAEQHQPEHRGSPVVATQVSGTLRNPVQVGTMIWHSEPAPGLACPLRGFCSLTQFAYAPTCVRIR